MCQVYQISSSFMGRTHIEQQQHSVLVPTCMKAFESKEGHLETQDHKDITRILRSFCFPACQTCEGASAQESPTRTSLPHSHEVAGMKARCETPPWLWLISCRAPTPAEISWLSWSRTVGETQVGVLPGCTGPGDPQTHQRHGSSGRMHESCFTCGAMFCISERWLAEINLRENVKTCHRN